MHNFRAKCAKLTQAEEERRTVGLDKVDKFFVMENRQVKIIEDDVFAGTKLSYRATL